MKQTKIICGFPGVGKSHLYRNQMKYGLKILDSDSSTFDKTEFPDNYIKHIKENIGKADVILVSSHKEVRDALVAEKLPHYFVHPCISMNMVYKKRYEDRGSDEKFINLIMNNWDTWIREILDEEPSIYRTNIKIVYDTMTNVVTSLFNIETPNDIE
ncbi:hypothetical protein HYO65_gp140 [Tenacibaculum phage PTm1]|uniref:Uncharacterized protein n=2 Tax=Shirahamavirus PTm1 TaxID=2846435 RepID=A0A5S9BZ27_9CAUD|nr:hypothetical protein HYO65_gp140 [Tenacibaculum phage PTm1]BBI90532.1 hypothetical protein [Tenacibaculum phage PTm1]BBI90840.1 hypothetical protein [Tenacibaculum phage PTm5]